MLSRIHPLGAISIRGFLFGLLLFVTTYYLTYLNSDVHQLLTQQHYLLFISVCFSFSLSILYICYGLGAPEEFGVAARAGLLGNGAAVGSYIAILWDSSWKPFGWYLCILCIFHYSEYLTTAVINPTSLTNDSFLLNHSKEYGVAAVASWVEFLLERWMLPGMKTYMWVTLLGLVLCLAGEVMRKLAMVTAKTNFNHLIQNEKQAGHELITHGIYSLCRHPSYAGWFWWSIGTQIVLCNPLCVVAYALASFMFFCDRIIYEEMTLINFFGVDYLDYQVQVGTGIPFIVGYQLEECDKTD